MPIKINTLNLRRYCLVALLCIGLTGHVIAQVQQVPEDKRVSPNLALVRSALLPGWGQASNGKILQGALFATVQTYTGFQVIRWHKQLPFASNEDEKNQVLQKRNLWAVGFVAGTVLSMADAYTDTHLAGLPEEEKPSPGISLVRSALLPGWGQLSNGKIIKAGIIFSGHVYMGYQFIRWHDKLQSATGADRRDNLEYTRNTWGWRFLAGYLLNLADAFVDAHLAGFPEDESLALNFQPLSNGWMMNVSIDF